MCVLCVCVCYVYVCVCVLEVGGGILFINKFNIRERSHVICYIYMYMAPYSTRAIDVMDFLNLG